MDSAEKTIAFIQKKYSTKEFIPLHEPRFNGNEKKYLMDTIDSTYVSSVGEYVDLFESAFGTYTRTKKAVAVVNGTASLHVALQLAGVNAGDEVITQALTFVATANAITYNNAIPVFLDVDLDTMGLSPKAIENFLLNYGEMRENGCYNKSTDRKISACLPMHTFGFPVKIDEIVAICSKWNIPVVEDAAESLGSYYKGKHTGSFGLISGFSFNGNKIITSGGGGMIITNDEKLGAKAKHLTTTAKKPHEFEFYHDELGYNYRMPNLNAALGYAQLERLDDYLQNKRKLAAEYADFFTDQNIKFRKEPKDTRANYWLMAIELENKDERDRFLERTNNKGVMTRPIWQLMFRLPMYSSCYRDEQKNALYLEERIVNIPSSIIE